MVVINTDTILEINTERIAQMNAYECGIKNVSECCLTLLESIVDRVSCEEHFWGCWVCRTFLNHLLTRFTYENLLLVSVVDSEAAHEALEEICSVCVFYMFVFVA